MASARMATLIAFVLLTCASAWTQEAQNASQTSVPVAQSNGDNLPLASSAVLNSDTRPPSGAQPVGLGVTGKNELNIDLNGNQSGQNNASGGSPNNWESISSFGGTLQLHFGTPQSQTLLTYTGNVVNYSDRTPAWTTYQNMAFSQSVKAGRWTLTGVDTFNYSPNSPFGWYGYGSTPASTSGVPATVNPQNAPNQTILTPTTTSYFNTVLGQVQYGLSRRSSWTASGSYGILRFPDSEFSNTNQLVASTGYNYSLTAKDTISVKYNYSQFQYTALGSSFTSQNVQLGYSHQVTGRLSLQVSGGPEFTNATSLGAAQKQVQFAGSANLMYSRGATSLALSYFEGTTAGSGVLTGARTDNAVFSASHLFAGQWTTGASVGYSRNSGVVQQQTYNTFYATPSIRKGLTRNLGVLFNYSYQRQISQSTCVGLACGTVSWSILSAGVDYRFRPIRLE